MKHSKFVKAGVLCFFILFLIAFVAYRSGYFEKRSDRSSTGEMELNTPKEITTMLTNLDSPPKKSTILMPGSKSIGLPDKPISKYDTKKRSVYNTFDTSTIKTLKTKEQASHDPVMFSGSKSGLVIPRKINPAMPEKEPAAEMSQEDKIDQLIKKNELEQQRIKDSLNRVKTPNDTVVFEPYFPSSKSGRLIIAPKKKYQNK